MAAYFGAYKADETTHLPLLHSLSHLSKQKSDYNREVVTKHDLKGQSTLLSRDSRGVRITNFMTCLQLVDFEFSYFQLFAKISCIRDFTCPKNQLDSQKIRNSNESAHGDSKGIGKKVRAAVLEEEFISKEIKRLTEEKKQNLIC